MFERENDNLDVGRCSSATDTFVPEDACRCVL